jgi:hypothetical protein
MHINSSHSLTVSLVNKACQYALFSANEDLCLLGCDLLDLCFPTVLKAPYSFKTWSYTNPATHISCSKELIWKLQIWHFTNGCILSFLDFL